MAATRLPKSDHAKQCTKVLCSLTLTAWLAMFGASVAKADVLRQDVTYEQGVPLLISVGEFATIGLSPIEWDGIGRRRIAFQLLVANNSDRTFDANPAQIVAKADGAPVPLVDASELAREVRRRGSWNRFALAVAGGLNASTAGSQAGRYTEQGTFRGNVVGPNADVRIRGNYSAQGYDGAAANAASQRQLEQTQALLHGSKQSDQARIDEVQDEVLLRTTVQPDDYIIRTIVLEAHRSVGEGSDLTLAIAVGGERHTLKFSKRSDQWEPHAQLVARQAAQPSTSAAPASVAMASHASATPAPAAPAPAAVEAEQPNSNPIGSATRAMPSSSIQGSATASVSPSVPTSIARPPDRTLAQLVMDEPMYLMHLSWAGEQIARHLAKNVKAGRRLSRAFQSDPQLLREGIAAGFAPFISRQDMEDAVLVALREDVPAAQIQRALSMSPTDRQRWYAQVSGEKTFQTHLLNNLRIPSSFQVVESLAAELHSRFPNYRFDETWEPD